MKEADRKRNPNSAVFHHNFDERLKVYKLNVHNLMYWQPCYSQWLEDTSVKYLDDWQDSVQKKKISKYAKPFCTLSYQTVEELKICGMQVISIVCHHTLIFYYSFFNS